MRSRAGAATPGPWKIDSNDCCVVAEVAPHFPLGERTGARHQDMRHAASWHPAVAFAVGDWLDRTAIDGDNGYDDSDDNYAAALAVATAYLGRSA